MDMRHGRDLEKLRAPDAAVPDGLIDPLDPHDPIDAIEPIVKLWILRILVLLGAHEHFIGKDGFRDDDLARALQLTPAGERPSDAEDLSDEFVEVGEDGMTEATKAGQPEALALLRQRHREAEAQAHRAGLPPRLARNSQRLAPLIGLDDVERRVLEFTVLLASDDRLELVAGRVQRMGRNRLVRALATVLDLPMQSIQTALEPSSLLLRSGLVDLNCGRRFELDDALKPLSTRFARAMVENDADLAKLLRGTVTTAGAPTLAVEDYAHVRQSIDIAVQYLRRAADDKPRGINILVHGRPGVGKTELARVIGAQTGREVLEIATEDEDGDPNSGAERLNAFRATQSLFSERHALVVFDEVEDIFGRGGFFETNNVAQQHKALINKMLETNPVPAIWLTNSIRGIDRAFMRRFDLVLELPVPPRSQRARIIRSAFGELIAEATVSRVAEVEGLAPALVTRAAKVARAVHGNAAATADAQGTIETLLDNALRAQGAARLDPKPSSGAAPAYEPAFVNADMDVVGLVDGLRRAGQARICLYGPPGTGKTAYARWLAEQLERPLLVKRASELLSKYVGENEQNIAAAFEEAMRDGAVLLIDEVDSFLRDRDQAERGWEASMVNEMLTQMETFAGFFIASTNRMDDLDAAVLRRFDCKAKFDFLTGDQAVGLLARTCEAIGLPAPTEAQQRVVRELGTLTPGDFAVVSRVAVFRPFENVERLIAALGAECALKKGARRRPVGFVI